jgi:hypothetical protein
VGSCVLTVDVELKRHCEGGCTKRLQPSRQPRVAQNRGWVMAPDLLLDLTVRQKRTNRVVTSKSGQQQS